MKTFLRHSVFTLLLVIIAAKGFASHIVGGAITYTYNGSNNYTIMLKLYRDCGPTSMANFPANVTIEALQANGTPFVPSRTVSIPGGAITNITPVLPPCATSPSVVPCVEERVYTGTITLAPSPGGMHLVYTLGNRNGGISNIVSPATAGETFYAFIPCYKNVWVEDFTLANGTTSDAGATAWTSTVTGTAPLPIAQVATGEFRITSQNSGAACKTIWTSQVIPISSYTNGVNLSVNYSDTTGNTLENSDTIKVYYSLNGGPLTLFPNNGQRTNDFDASIFATATGLVGNNVQIVVRAAFGAGSPNDEVYEVDMVTVYDNTFLPNSSPNYTSLPPLLFCSTNAFNLNHSATDADGDVLVYSMYTPYDQTPATYPNNIFTVNTVTWNPGYSANSPFNSGGPNVTLNPSTGMLTGVANTNGSFVFGVKCQEYRGGYLLSEMTRDYQVTAVTCPPFVPPAPIVGANSASATSTSSMCVGQTLSLTASYTAGVTYNWTGPNGFTSSVQNPTISNVTLLASGVYSVTATISGCTGPAGTVAIVVNPIPAAPTATANTPLCAGQTLTFSASSPSVGTYNWSGPNSFTSAVQNPTITGVTAAATGSYSVNITVSGCTSPNGTLAITVNPIPAAPTATVNGPICAGQNLNLGASSTGTSFSWTGPNSFTSTAQNPTITGAGTVAAGVYSVTATALGCTSSSGTVSATVNNAPPAPVPGANTPLCAGQTLSLTASSVGATYNWSGPNSFTSTSQNPTIIGTTTLATGVYTVNAFAFGCPGPTATVSVTINPAPAAPTAGASSPICAGQTLSLTASSVGTSYSWTGPNSFTSTTQNPTIAGATTAASGVYSVNATALGCTGPTGTVNVTVNPIPAAPTATANTPICAGQTLSLTSTFTASTTYGWTGPNSFSSALQNPTIAAATTAASGVYSVTATRAGCTGPAALVNVTVNPIPVTPTLSASTPICAGQTLSLTSQTISGASYNWSGPNSFSSTSQNPTISGVTTAASGTYSVNVTVSGCTGSSGTVAVTVNPIPAAPTATATSPICAGQTLSLTSTFTAATTYNWTGPNSFTSALQNPTIAGATTAASGVYSVTATRAGCTGPAALVNVTVNPIPPTPTASATSPICSGQTLSLSATFTGAATYSWSGPNSFSSTLQNPTITNAGTVTAGVYSVVATVAGCSNPLAGTVAVTVNQTPAAPVAGGTSTLCAGSTISLTASSTGSTYNWAGPNGFTSSTQNPTIAGASTLATGVYSVTATSAAGCTGPAGTFSVSVFGNPPTPTLTASSPLCAGQTLSLTSQTILGASYNWTGPNSFSSASQNPNITNVTMAANGTYSVFVNVSGCGSTAATIAVNVNATPAAPTATANSPICDGQTLNLGASSTGATYNWTGPNSFSSTSQNPSITNAGTVTAGVYSVSATSAAGCTGPIGTVSVTINPIPAAPTATATSPICAGQTLSLTSTFTAATTYNWTGPNSFTSAIQNPTIAGATTAASGVYSVTATRAGCTGPAALVNVTVNPIPPTPTASANSPICSGQTLSLSATYTAVATYSWTGPNSFSSTLQNPTITNAGTITAGVYSVVATVAGCSNPLPGTVTVTVNQTPAAPIAGGTSTLCENSTINLTASTITGATYSWTGPNSFTANIQNPSIPLAGTVATGMYSVTATSTAGCTGPAGTFSVSVFGNPSAPTLGANAPVCTGQTLSLTATSILGASYNWTGPNSFTSSVQNPTIGAVTAAAAGNYSVLVTVMGCGSSAATISVTLNNTPAAPTATASSPICDGQTLNLGASSTGATYNWTGPNSFSSTSQNPSIPNAGTVTAGVYSVSATSAAGCVGPIGTVSVTINPIPAAPTATANSPICAGQTLSLSATFTAGTTYGWAGPNGFSSATQNPTIANATPLASGIYSVTATRAGCTGPEALVSVTVNPIPGVPTIITANSPLCAGQTLSLTASTVAGATYTWTGPNSFTSSVQNPTTVVSTTLASGTYSVYSLAAGCLSTLPGTVSVLVNPTPAAPIAGGTSTLCENSNINLTASTITGATYSWTGPNSFTANIQNPSIPSAGTVATGVYSVTATSTAGCTGPAGTFSVSVFGNPSAPTLGANVPVCTGQTLSLTATSILGATYNWTGPNSFTSSVQNPTIGAVTAAASGNYSVLVSVMGCGSSNAVISITVNPTPSAPLPGSNSPICDGQTLNLTASTIAGATYDWTGPNSFTANIQNPSVTGATTLASGPYFVAATSSLGCTGPVAAINVTVNPLPAAPSATATTPICAGQNISFTSNTISGATYSWSGPNSFTASTQNTSITGASTAASGVYTVYATVLGCSGPADTVNVTVNPIPTAPIASNNSPVCAGQTFTLDASPIAGATYSWTGPSSFTSSVQNPTVTGSASTAGVYSVTSIVAGCSSTNAVTTVTINPTPTPPIAGSNSPICLGGNINLTSSGGANYNWTGPNSFSSTLQNPSVTGASTLDAGTYSVTSTVAGCTSSPSTVAVVVSVPAIVSAGSNQTVCANNGTTALVGSSTTGSGSWTTSGTGTFSPNSTTLTTSYVPSAADNAAGTVTLTLTSTNNGGCAAVNNQIVLNITPSPTAFAGPDQSICANNSTVTLGGSVSIATGGTWTTTGTGSFVPNNTVLNPSYVPSAADIAGGTVAIVLGTTGNGNCFAHADTSIITFFAAPVVNAGSNPQYACKNNPNLVLNGTSTTGSGVWTTLGSGAFTPTNTILNPTYVPSTADTTAGNVTLILTSTNNGTCNQVSDTIQIIYTYTITISAGISPTVCANNPTVALNGTCTTGAGSWTTSGTGTFAPNTLGGVYVPSPADIGAGMVTLTVTSGNNGTCLPIQDQVNVYINPGPTANAGTSQTVCANNANVALSGSVTLATGGQWSSTGTGTFSPNNTTLTTSYIPSAADTAAGSVSIILETTGNGNCFPSYDTIQVTITPAPLVSAGTDIYVCRNNPVATLNGASSTGTGTWTTLGSGNFSNNSILNPVYTPSTADTTAGSVMLVLTSGNNGGCNPVTDTVNIVYTAVPTITAGLSQTVCANNPIVILNGSSTTGAGTWTSSGTGTFVPNALSGTYTASSGDISAGAITLTVTSTNNGGCLSVSDQLTVTIGPAPTVISGTNQAVCANTASVVLNGSVTIATGGLWSSSGTGTFSPNTSTLNTSYVPSSADTTAGSVIIYLTSTGNGNCNQVVDSMVIDFMSAPLVFAGADQILCDNVTNVSLNGTSSTGTATWTTLGSGNFSPNAGVLNPSYSPSAADTAAGSVQVVISSLNNGVCSSTNDTLTISFQSRPKANFAFANKCLNAATTFTDMSTVSSGTIISWLWNFGNDTSAMQNPINTFTATGSQTVSLVVSNGGCTDSIAKVLYVNPNPTAAFTHTSLCHDSAAFQNMSTITPGAIQSWNWDFGDASSSALQNPYHVYADTGTYYVTLSVTSDSGCVASIIDTVRIDPCDNITVVGTPTVPSIFTPNGDGKNDVLFVKGGPFDRLDFKVFNEWGNKIFESTVQSTGWDGTFKGSAQPVGRYVWTVDGETIDGRTIKKAGEVLLTR